MNSTRQRPTRCGSSPDSLFRASRDLKLTAEQQRAIRNAELAMGYTPLPPVVGAHSGGHITGRLVTFAILAIIVVGIARSIRHAAPSRPRVSHPVQRPVSRVSSRAVQPASRPAPAPPLPAETRLNITQPAPEMPAGTASHESAADPDPQVTKAPPEVAVRSHPRPELPGLGFGPVSPSAPPLPGLGLPDGVSEDGRPSRVRFSPKPGPAAGGEQAPQQRRDGLRDGWHRFGQDGTANGRIAASKVNPAVANSTNRWRHFGDGATVNRRRKRRSIFVRVLRGIGKAPQLNRDLLMSGWWVPRRQRLMKPGNQTWPQLAPNMGGKEESADEHLRKER